MTSELPKAITREQGFLAAIASRLDEQNTLLTDIRDRLPAQQQPATGQALSEETAAELIEPALSGSGEVLTEPAPVKKPPARRAARKPAMKKET